MSIDSICAIVVTYNSGKNYIDNFLLIKDQVERTIIIDNGSDVETIEILKYLEKEYSEVVIIYNEANLGLATAQNIGIGRSIDMGYEWVLLLDDDSSPQANMINHMRNFYNKSDFKNDIGILAPDIINLPYYKRNIYICTNENFSMMRRKFKHQEYFEVYFAIASGSLMKTSIYLQIGRFKDDFFIDYIDVEYGLRLFINGFKNIVIKKAKLKHRLGNRKQIKLGRFTIITSNHNHIRKYYIFRNRIKVWKLFFLKIPKFVIYDIIASVYFFLETVIFERDKLRKFKYILKGIIEGIRVKIK